MVCAAGIIRGAQAFTALSSSDPPPSNYFKEPQADNDAVFEKQTKILNEIEKVRRTVRFKKDESIIFQIKQVLVSLSPSSEARIMQDGTGRPASPAHSKVAQSCINAQAKSWERVFKWMLLLLFCCSFQNPFLFICCFCFFHNSFTSGVIRLFLRCMFYELGLGL